MAIAVCPPADDLERLFLGGIAEHEADALERHVMDCAVCLDRLKNVFGAKDPLAKVLSGDIGSNAYTTSPVCAGLIEQIKSMRHSLKQGSPMITISCSTCQKKLAVKEESAGKKVKCPGCGHVMPVPALQPVHAEDRTVPPMPLLDSPTIPPSQSDASDPPTHPPLSQPDPTQDVDALPHADFDSSLTDFLAPAQAPDELGRLGDYRILKILGHGGMGVVYKAEDPKLKRTVAIKAMLPTLAASASSGKRFLREAQTMAAVEHDHIVRIYQVAEERGVPFMAMEFLKGEPLDERLKRDEEIPLTEMLRIGREIAEGLSAAHATGLIHRDIKPANIWLEERNPSRARQEAGSPPLPDGRGSVGRVKILDFGLARAASQDAGLTQQGSIIGTPAYMAPEQGRGDTVDARCDLFSLGVVLYRLCTGNQPFVGKDTVSTLMAVAMNEPAAPITLNPALPRELSDLVMKLLEKDVDKRIGSADEVVHAIQSMEQELARKKASTEDTIGTTFTPSPHATKERAASTPAETISAVSAPPRKRSRRPVFIAMGAGLLLVVGMIVAMDWHRFILIQLGIIRISNEQGDYVINTDDPDFAFSVKKGSVILHDKKTDRKFNLKVIGTNKAGEHELEVTDIVADLSFKTKNFTIRRGQVVALKAWFERKLEEAKAPPPVVPPASRRFALKFTENDGVEVSSLLYDKAATYTIEAYVTSTRGQARTVGASWALGFDKLALIDRVLASKNFETGWYFGQPGGAAGYLVGPAPLEANRRIHLAGVRTGKTFRLFMDGKLIVNKQAGSVGDSKQGLMIGHKFEGIVGEVRISKVARYDQDFTPETRFKPDADTLALYHFDEGTGDVLNDSSSNGHHGKIVGAIWVNADGSPIAPKSPAGLEFDGKGLVEIKSLRLPVSGPLTIEGFVTVARHQEQLEASVAGVDRQLNLVIGAGKEKGLLRPRVTLATKEVSLSTMGVIDTGRRIHVALVRSGATSKLFIDGKEISKKSAAGSLADSPESFVLAKNLIGRLEEIRVSTTARYDSDFTPAKRFKPDGDTLALYHFDEGTGDVLKDSSGNKHHGKITGAKWVNADGTDIKPPASNHALQFDGKTSYVDLPTVEVDTTKPFTLEARVHPQAKDVEQMLIGNYIGTEGLGFWIAAHNGLTGRIANPLESLTTTSYKALGMEWSHVALVFDGEVLSVFKDGIPLAKSLDMKKIQSSRVPFRIGARYKGLTLPKTLGPVGRQPIAIFNGLIDEVRISKIARYMEPFTPSLRHEPDANTIALYHFDEGEGEKLTDATGQHHGKIVGARWVKVEATPVGFAPLEELTFEFDLERDGAILRAMPTLRKLNGKAAADVVK